MGRVTVKCEYPFWLPGNFLFHAEYRSARFEVFSAWKKQLEKKVNKLNSTTIHSRLVEAGRAQMGNPNHIWDKALALLQEDCKWSIPGFRHLKKGEDQSLAQRFLPVNLDNSKGGVLLGRCRMVCEEGKKEEGEKEEGEKEEGEKKKGSQLLHVLHKAFGDMMCRLQNGHGLAGAAAAFDLKAIDFEIAMYDWSIGFISISYVLEFDCWPGEAVPFLKEVDKKMRRIFTKRFYREEDFFPETELPFAQDIMDSVPTQERRGGKVNPFRMFMNYVVRAFMHHMPGENAVDLVGDKNPLHANGTLRDFFRIQLEIKGAQEILPFKEDIRLPFVASHFIFEPANQTELDLLKKEEFEPIISSNPNVEVDPSALELSLPGYIEETDSGFSGNYMVLPVKKLGALDANSHRSWGIQAERTLWLWRLAMIYYASLHRIHSHLVARKGLHLEVLAQVAAKKIILKADSLDREAERLETMRIAIEVAIQESTLTYMCDTAFFRNVFQRIKADYLFDELVDNVRLQTPILIKDLKAKHQKRQSNSLKSLNFFVFVSLSISVAMAFIRIIEIDKIKKILLEGLFETPLSRTASQWLNYISLLFLLVAVCWFIQWLAKKRLLRD